MSWVILDKLCTHDFDVVRDPIGGFKTKREAVDFYIERLERERADLARAMRKARQMRRRAKG
ncbi:hypothetical protein [Brevundimonas sp. UBA7664]|uniref:hypothetical protein n=1 Tax=Brevundimonas sp. UBA7664 TaxID=1946141 RepID=UPI0025BBF071|nr:hypothetical protein [Brevundimonas sp. UBA7664]